MNGQAAEATIAGVAKNVALGGGTVAVYGGWSANEIAAFGGLIVAIIGLCVQVYFKRKEDRRNDILHRARMAGFKLPGDPE